MNPKFHSSLVTLAPCNPPRQKFDSPAKHSTGGPSWLDEITRPTKKLGERAGIKRYDAVWWARHFAIKSCLARGAREGNNHTTRLLCYHRGITMRLKNLYVG